VRLNFTEICLKRFNSHKIDKKKQNEDSMFTASVVELLRADLVTRDPGRIGGD
jgi:hypothetical protein